MCGEFGAMEDDGSGKEDLEGETHTVWQILPLSFVFLCLLAIHYRPIMCWPLFVLPGQPGQVG